MKVINLIALAAATAIATTILIVPLTAGSGTPPETGTSTPAAPERKTLELTHAEETWISALEWCESRGDNQAINPADLDGTPSYYAFQWKPATFFSFAIAYGVIPEGTTAAEARELMKDYRLQLEVIRHMISDDTVKLSGQFPACFRKLGPPPEPPICTDGCPLIKI